VLSAAQSVNELFNPRYLDSMGGCVFKYRVRGIYATALAKLILDSEAELVDLSKQLADRLGMDRRSDVAPDATIKVSRDPNRIIVVGFRDAVMHFVNKILGEIPGLAKKVYEVGPYSVLKVKVIRRDDITCYAETPLGKAILQDARCYEGEELVAHVVKLPLENQGPVVIKRGAAVVGRYVTVSTSSDKPVVLFSEFIKDMDRRAELFTLSQQVLREGINVKWRSAAKEANIEVLTSELQEVIKKLREVGSKAREVPVPGVVQIGESIAMIEMSSVAKRALDDVRRKVVPTTPLHHELKACIDMPNELVEFADMVSSYVDPGALELAFLKYLYEKMKDISKIYLEHRKPDGEVITIGPIEIEKVTFEGNRLELVGQRTVKSPGVYDGINVEKEPGDRIETRIMWNEWYVVHRYFSADGKLKGIYVNINTPPELCPRGMVRYLDLYVDVVYDALSNEKRIVDKELLQEAKSKGLIGEDLYTEATKRANNALDMIERFADYPPGAT